MNLNTIATNIASRFSAANLTAPSGLTNVTLSTHLLPNGITDTPTVLVKPPTASFEYGMGARVGILEFPVEFYVAEAADLTAAAKKLYSWYDALIDQLKADYDLGTASEVVDGTVTETRTGTLVYGTQEYVGIVLTIRVRIDGAYNAST